MVRGRRLSVGKDPVDLAAGTRTSGVNIQALRNRGEIPVWIGEVGDGYLLEPGESFPASIALGSSDALKIVADVGDDAEATADVDVVLGYEAIFTGDEGR